MEIGIDEVYRDKQVSEISVKKKRKTRATIETHT